VPAIPVCPVLKAWILKDVWEVRLFTEFNEKLAPEIAAETQLFPPAAWRANLLKFINHFPIG
jgi:hypothetical protein